MRILDAVLAVVAVRRVAGLAGARGELIFGVIVVDALRERRVRQAVFGVDAVHGELSGTEHGVLVEAGGGRHLSVHFQGPRSPGVLVR